MIALDQTEVWEGMERAVARSLRGQRVYRYRQRYKGEKHTVIGAISLRGVVGCRVIKDGMKKGDSLEFLRSELCPKPDARKIVIMDNLNIHRSWEVEELIRTGARILYLSVYVPELNPIEMMWSVLKHFIRKLFRIGKSSMEQIVKTSIHPASEASLLSVATVPLDSLTGCQFSLINLSAKLPVETVFLGGCRRYREPRP